jgi:AcrR family transcriptional regulator
VGALVSSVPTDRSVRLTLQAFSMHPTTRYTDQDGFSRRRTIIAEATRLFLEKGYSATSMSQLAKACGVQKASLYHHFPSKEALFVACATDGFDEAILDLERIRHEASIDDDTRILRAVDAVYRINLHSNCGRMTPLIAEVSRSIPVVARAFHDQFILKQQLLMNGIIDDGIARGSFRPTYRIGLEHIIFGPVIKLALEIEMFTTFDGLSVLRPVDQIRTEHGALVLQLLKQGLPPSHDRR